ncbi:MAG: cyclic nucleotide-binding domain-containing protein [Pseudomonadota bacterium]
MKTTPIKEYPIQLLTPHLQRIPFFKELMENAPEQYDTLLHYSYLTEPEKDEVIISKGERDPWMYFVLKGKLVVYPESTLSPHQSVNYILPGEIVGALALIKNEPRGATVTNDSSSRSTMLLGIHFSAFGELTNFRQLNMRTKLELLKMVTDHTRWKIEQYRSMFPTNPLGKRLNSLDIFRGKKNSIAELRSLHHEARQLGEMLAEWNTAFQYTRKYQNDGSLSAKLY